MSQERARQSLEFLWPRLARPLNTAPAVGALLGLPQSVTRQFVGATIAASAATDALLDAMPRLLRSLSISTLDASVRCIGEVRGPVLWSATIAARSATAGDPGLFVCSTPARAYDTPDNRVLASALEVIRQAGTELDKIAVRRHDDEMIRRARLNSSRALRYLDHRSLASLDRRRPPPRAIHRARAGRRPSFRLAMAVLARADEPVEIDHLLPFCDDDTIAQHDVLVAVVRQLQSHGIRLPPFHVDLGALRSGPLSYRHTASRDEGIAGIQVGHVVFEVPEGAVADRRQAEADLLARTPGHLSAHLVLSRADIGRGIEEAILAGI